MNSLAQAPDSKQYRQGYAEADRLITLTGDWVKGQLADVDLMVDAIAARYRELPDTPHLLERLDVQQALIWDLIYRVRGLELMQADMERELATLRKERGSRG